MSYAVTSDAVHESNGHFTKRNIFCFPTLDVCRVSCEQTLTIYLVYLCFYFYYIWLSIVFLSAIYSQLPVAPRI